MRARGTLPRAAAAATRFRGCEAKFALSSLGTSLGGARAAGRAGAGRGRTQEAIQTLTVGTNMWLHTKSYI